MAWTGRSETRTGPAPAATRRLAAGRDTIDLEAADVEVYGRKKRGMAYNYQGQRAGRPHVAAWAETEIVLAADLGSGTDDPARPRRICCAGRWPPCRRRHARGAGWRCAPTPAISPGRWPAPPMMST